MQFVSLYPSIVPFLPRQRAIPSSCVLYPLPSICPALATNGIVQRHHLCTNGSSFGLTDPLLKAPIGFLTGSGDTSCSLRAEVVKLRAAGREVRRRIAWPAVLDAIVVIVRFDRCFVFVCRVMEEWQETVI